MKTGKLIFALLASVVLVSAQSCLKNQADIFDESSSERLQNLLEDTYAVLQGSSSGWLMEYYPGANQKFGGYAYHLMFDEQEVSVVCELDPENAYTSLYKMTDDNGAVLSFDGYNEALHFFATPSSSEYEAKGGDFEFNVVSVSADNIELRGKRSGNFYNLHRFPEGITPQAYMAKVSDMAESMRAAIIEGKIGDTDVVGEVDFNYRRIVFKYMENEEEVMVTTPFMYTPEGLCLYKPYKVAGATLYDFMYHVKNNVLTNGSYTFQGKLPEDYVSYAAFQGQYTLMTTGGNYNITISADETGKNLVLSGLDSHFDCHLEYDPAKGRAKWYGETVGENGANSIWLVATSGGNLYVTQNTGMVVHWDIDNECFVFSDNGEGPDGFNADGWVLWEVDAAGNSVGQWQSWGKSYFGAFTKMVRK